jgi:hypothetical protein
MDPLFKLYINWSLISQLTARKILSWTNRYRVKLAVLGIEQGLFLCFFHWDSTNRICWNTRIWILNENQSVLNRRISWATRKQNKKKAPQHVYRQTCIFSCSRNFVLELYGPMEITSPERLCRWDIFYQSKHTNNHWCLLNLDIRLLLFGTSLWIPWQGNGSSLTTAHLVSCSNNNHYNLLTWTTLAIRGSNVFQSY